MHASLRSPLFSSAAGTLVLGASLLLATSLVGCSRSPVDGEMTKDEARQLGGRGTDGRDLCDAQGWYGDGTCDDFCVRQDPDCTPGGGSTCGGLAGRACASGEYCHYSESAQCGAADQTGTCKSLPDACGEIFSETCGCDGRTYGNPCEANAAGTSVAYAGACEGNPPPPIDGGPGPGQLCGTRGASECPDGQFCLFDEGTQCGALDQGGTCQDIPEVCTEEYAPVCGCDGVTYSNDCFANGAGVSVATIGECAGTGKFCGGLTGAGCADGQFCNIPVENICGAADGGGTCEEIPQGCTREYNPVCGCDGQSYGNPCEAAAHSTSIISYGECEPQGKSCGARAGDTCAADEFCYFTPSAICGYADAEGTCQPRPEACTQDVAPVCGCNGMTYSNSCAANAAGQGVYQDGECATPTP